MDDEAGLRVEQMLTDEVDMNIEPQMPQDLDVPEEMNLGDQGMEADNAFAAAFASPLRPLPSPGTFHAQTRPEEEDEIPQVAPPPPPPPASETAGHSASAPTSTAAPMTSPLPPPASEIAGPSTSAPTSTAAPVTSPLPPPAPSSPKTPSPRPSFTSAFEAPATAQSLAATAAPISTAAKSPPLLLDDGEEITAGNVGDAAATAMASTSALGGADASRQSVIRDTTTPHPALHSTLRPVEQSDLQLSSADPNALSQAVLPAVLPDEHLMRGVIPEMDFSFDFFEPIGNTGKVDGIAADQAAIAQDEIPMQQQPALDGEHLPRTPRKELKRSQRKSSRKKSSDIEDVPQTVPAGD